MLCFSHNRTQSVALWLNSARSPASHLWSCKELWVGDPWFVVQNHICRSHPGRSDSPISWALLCIDQYMIWVSWYISIQPSLSQHRVGVLLLHHGHGCYCWKVGKPFSPWGYFTRFSFTEETSPWAALCWFMAEKSMTLICSLALLFLTARYTGSDFRKNMKDCLLLLVSDIQWLGHRWVNFLGIVLIFPKLGWH